MNKKIIFILVSILIITVLASGILFKYLYLRPLKTETKIEFDKEKKEVIFSFKYPIKEEYFLKNFEITPETEEKFVFENKLQPPLNILGYRDVRVLPRDIEMDKVYKVKTFEKEFTFSLPSPKPKEITFNEEDRELTIYFFDSIEEDYFFEKLKLEPKIDKGEYAFLDSGEKIVFRPESIEEDKDYKVEILGKSLSFKIESPKTKDIYFDKEKKEVVMTFTKAVNEARFFENFKVSPPLRGEFIFDDSKTEIIFKLNNIKEGENYKIDILGKSLGFGIESSLEPKPKPVASEPAFAPQPQLTSENKLIDVDLSEQKLRLYEEGKVTAEYTISSGKSAMPTPTGNFQVLKKEENHWSTQYALYMPYAMQFYNGYYIHELPYWPGGYREGEEHLGIPVSHGCVRLGIGTAENVYNFADVGTEIIIHK